MTRATWKFAMVLALVLSVAGMGACGDDDGGGSGPVPLNQVQSSYVRAYCQLAMDCQFDSFTALFAGDVDTCVDFMETMGGVDEGLEEIIASVNAGNTSYDAALARECIDAMESLSCEEAYGSEEPAPECEDTFAGLLANGTDCTMDLECAGGWCDTNATCPGVCSDAVLIGGDCSMGDKCETGSECESGLCVVNPGPLALGDPCTDSYRECGYGLWCDGAGNGVCENRAPVGAACDSPEQCEHGLFCNGDGECAEIVLVDEVGAACGGFEYSPMCNIGLGLACAAEYMDGVEYTVCVEMLSQGESCMEMDSMTEVVTVLPCDMFAGLYCDMDFQNFTGVCAAKLAGGAQCDDDDQCQSDYCQMDGTCWEEPTSACD